MTMSQDEQSDKGLIEAYEEPEGYEKPVSGGWGEYPLDELAIRDERRTAVDAWRRIEQGRFFLDPDFQRDFVWDEKKQSRLIESIIMRIPLPVFYVAEDDQGRLIAVDGRQRLATLQRFFKNELKLRFDGDRPELEGKNFKDFEPRLQNRVEDCQLTFYIIESKVPERARLDIFDRVNSGEPLTRQQMRNALHNGPATQFLRDEAKTSIFLDATGRSLSAKRMQDREFVNRFCSFTLLDLCSYKGDMDDWLNTGILELGKDGVQFSELSLKIQRGLLNNFIVFGKHAFRKHHQINQAKRGIINASLFDVMSTGLSRVDEAIVRERAEGLRQAFYARMDDSKFETAITYSPNSTKNVLERFRIVDIMLKEVFGDVA
jgi:hypothetical protein